MSTANGVSQLSVSKISELTRGILESEKNVNNIVDLLECVQDHNEDTAVLKAAIEGLCSVYCHMISKHYHWLVEPTTGRGVTSGKRKRNDDYERRSKKRKRGAVLPQQQSEECVDQYESWMKECYLVCRERLLRLVVEHSQSEIQWLSLSSLLKLIRSEGHTHQKANHIYHFPNKCFHRVVSHLLDNQTEMTDLIGQFQDFLKYDDVRFYWLKNIASVVLSKIDSKLRRAKISEQFVSNVHKSLRIIRMPTYEGAIGRFLAGIPPERERPVPHVDSDEASDDEDLDKEEIGKVPTPKKKRSKSEIKALSVTSLQKHRKHFSDAWLAFLRLPLCSSQYKQVLVCLHSDVMPHLQDPRLLIDFLTYSYDAGGVVSLLALNGLFILMNNYHLDYPDFYAKLYQLLGPEVFHVKYMQRFFSLLDTFLSSSHLPLYLVAAFAKKVARLSLTAPPNGVMVGVIFVTNLVKRHPNCRVLLHRKNAEDFQLPSGNDPFDLCEPDPANCGALDSCLWELQTLQRHYSPAVSSLLDELLNPDLTNSKVEADLGQYLDMDSQQMYEDACEHITEDVPLNFHEPLSLWQPGQLPT